MSENTLDMLDRVHGRGRDFIAEQIVAGASNAQVADAIAAKFGVDPPSVRSVSHWANHDSKLLAKVATLREDGADPQRAHATVIAALEDRLENPDKLSVGELVEIKKALERQSGKSSTAARPDDDSGGIPRAALDAWLFGMATDYSPESERFREVFEREGATWGELVAAMPANANELLEQAIEDWDGHHLSDI